MRNLLSGRGVLVIEDEMLVAALLQDMLADLGCVVIGPAAGVEEALALIETQVFDIAVLDVNLGGQMSYPVADALLARHVPFTFSTGYASNRLQEGYRTLPALQKPYHVTELQDALAEVMAQAKLGADDGPGMPPLEVRLQMRASEGLRDGSPAGQKQPPANLFRRWRCAAEEPPRRVR